MRVEIEAGNDAVKVYADGGQSWTFCGLDRSVRVYNVDRTQHHLERMGLTAEGRVILFRWQMERPADAAPVAASASAPAAAEPPAAAVSGVAVAESPAAEAQLAAGGPADGEAPAPVPNVAMDADAGEPRDGIHLPDKLAYGGHVKDIPVCAVPLLKHMIESPPRCGGYAETALLHDLYDDSADSLKVHYGKANAALKAVGHPQRLKRVEVPSEGFYISWKEA